MLDLEKRDDPVSWGKPGVRSRAIKAIVEDDKERAAANNVTVQRGQNPVTTIASSTMDGGSHFGQVPIFVAVRPPNPLETTQGLVQSPALEASSAEIQTPRVKRKKKAPKIS